MEGKSAIRAVVSAPASPTVAKCSSGNILLVSMQKLRNPAFQRFGADLRKTLMITSVVKQARKFYQLGSDVPINCSCVRPESIFMMAVDDTKMPVQTIRQAARKHSLVRKTRKPKVSCSIVDESTNHHILDNDDSQRLPESISFTRSTSNSSENLRNHSSHTSFATSSYCTCSQCIIVPKKFRYFQYLNSDDTPPVKKRRLTLLPRETTNICITATVY